jgi:nitrite reductase (NO-forming)
MPRWVKILVIVGIIVLIVAIAVLVLGGSQHGPGRHLSNGTHSTPTNNSTTTPASPHAGASHVTADAREIGVTADQLSFRPDEITVIAGTDVTIALAANDARHDFVIDELGAHVTAEKGETARGTFNAGSPGRYTYYCSEPGHREAGMVGTLIVQAHHG